MSLQNRATDDLVRIAASGGGFRLEARTRMTDDLVRIAAAAKRHGARLILSGMAVRPTDDLVRIGAAGAGAVMFED